MSSSGPGTPAVADAADVRTPPGPGQAPVTHTARTAALSAAELRTGMQQHFRANGSLRQLKTQLRGMMLTDLLQHPKAARMLVAGTAQSIPPSSIGGHRRLEDAVQTPVTTADVASRVGAPIIPSVTGRNDGTLQTWSCGLADALVENHLRRTRRAMSLSIFSTEAEVPPFSASGAPSEEEAYLAHLFHQADADSGSKQLTGGISGGDDDILVPSPSRSVKSVLQRVVEAYVGKYGAAGSGGAQAHHLHHCSTQTDASDVEKDATNPLISLECRLAAVDARYALTFSQLRRSSSQGDGQPIFLRAEVERRLAQYKADMHAQLRSEYEHKYDVFTRNKLLEAQEEAERRYRAVLRTKAEEYAEMERSTLVKLEQERERMKLSWEDVRQHRVEIDRRQREMTSRTAAHEMAIQEKSAELQRAKEAARALQLQCAKWEELCATRLMELDGARSREGRRVEDLRRLQAEHAAELQLKEEEVGRLHFRLRMLLQETVSGGAMRATEPPQSDVGGKVEQIQRQRPHDASSGSAAGPPVNPQELYGLLVRTEQLQRNAAVHQQQQQQRWDAAWAAAPTAVAAASAASPAMMAAVPSPTAPSSKLSLQALHVVATAVQAPEAHVETPSAVRATAAPGSPARPIPTPERTAAKKLAPALAAPRLPSPTASISSLASSAPISTPIRLPKAQVHSPPSSASSGQKPVSSIRTPVAAAVAARPASTTTSLSSPPTASSKSPSSAAASSGGRQSFASTSPSVHSGAPAAGIDMVAVTTQEAVQDEITGRASITSEEESARAGITWSEQNKRELVAEAKRQAQIAEGDAGVTRPWERRSTTFGEPPMAAAAVTAVNDVFSESFSTDDEALFNSSEEDDSEF